MTELLLVTSPRVAAMAVAECGEPVLDVGAALPVDGAPRAHLERTADRWHARVRVGVADRLVRAAADLRRSGATLVLAEGYRPVRQQAAYFASYLGVLRAEHPHWSQRQLRLAASRFVSPPELAPHSTGGAVDVLLVDDDGNDLDMGTPLNASPEDSAEACFTAAAGVSVAARRHRELLIAAMTAAGFVNYPTEWWHWSYGDRYWAVVRGAAAARYGSVDLEPVASINVL